MGEDYGINIHIAAIFHADDTLDVGVNIDDSEGVNVSCDVQNQENVEEAVKELAFNVLKSYVTQSAANKEVDASDIIGDIDNTYEKYSPENIARKSGKGSINLSNKLNDILNMII